MFFYNSDTSSVVTPIKKFIFTLRGFLYIWNILKAKNFKYMAPRAFNQDPVENFFSCIRSHGVRNTKPNCSFISSRKALINVFVSSHSVGSNCEPDESIGVLDNLKTFVQVDSVSPLVEHLQVPPPIYATAEVHICNHPFDFGTPYILSQINCKYCRRKMETLGDDYQNILIETRGYLKGECYLMHPSSSFYRAFRHIVNIISYTLPKLIISYDIRQEIIKKLETEEDIGYVFCEEHQNNKIVTYKICANIILFNYISKVNKILGGIDLRQLTRLAFAKFSKKKR